jgi:hypothetical protein
MLMTAIAAYVILPAHAQDAPLTTPGCEHLAVRQCLNLAIDAMGGRERLQQIKSVRLQAIGHTLLMEQSYRQAPFITSYETSTTTFDLVNQRVLSEVKLTWPESDDNQSESESVNVVGPDGGIRRGKESDAPCSLADLDAARYALALGPLRLLLTADTAFDLHYDSPASVRSTSHTVVSFTWQKVPVRILLNPFNHLPDAVDTTQELHDFWYFWGDVRQRVYFDNWKQIQGIAYPTNLVEQRNGETWRSTQALKVEFNIPLEDSHFRSDPAAAKKSLASTGWSRRFRPDKDNVLAPGVDLFLGSWNSTIVKQPDGIVILEVPISERYTEGVVEEARRRYPGKPIMAALSTSDSWPHTGGVRFVVSQGIPVYILDLNRPLLEQLIQAPHTLDPDALQKSQPRKAPDWMIVSRRVEIGSGPNRIELYPLRGASTERQYMVYFPEHHLLYASDTLVLNDDGTLYDPELMTEVAQAVTREKLSVETVFAMHQGATEWNTVLRLIGKAQGK